LIVPRFNRAVFSHSPLKPHLQPQEVR